MRGVCVGCVPRHFFFFPLIDCLKEDEEGATLNSGLTLGTMTLQF